MASHSNKAEEDLRNAEIKNQSLIGRLKEGLQNVKDYLSDENTNSWEGTKGLTDEAMVPSTAQRTKKSEVLPNKGEIIDTDDLTENLISNEQKKNEKM